MPAPWVPLEVHPTLDAENFPVHSSLPRVLREWALLSWLPSSSEAQRPLADAKLIPRNRVWVCSPRPLLLQVQIEWPRRGRSKHRSDQHGGDRRPTGRGSPRILERYLNPI